MDAPERESLAFLCGIDGDEAIMYSDWRYFRFVSASSDAISFIHLVCVKNTVVVLVHYYSCV
jgi:hypothetical protein